MKKLSLKNLKLDGNDLLKREQLKTVLGGYGSGLYCGCRAGDNQPSNYCVSWVCESACIGHGGWTGVCISVG